MVLKEYGLDSWLQCWNICSEGTLFDERGLAIEVLTFWQSRVILLGQLDFFGPR
jgi:hypothetical protein